MRAALALIVIVAASAANACTTFCTRGLFGRNYDFEIGYGMVVVNKRGMEKSSQRENGARLRHRWTSRFGSVTFNQFGRDNPMGGMNEKGLVVELMWLDGTRYPKPDARPEVGTLEWIQYQLDTATTVEDVIASAKKIRIFERGTPLHFLVADAAGKTAAIEFLDGELVVHRDAAALANDRYADSLAAMKSGANDRFARAAKGLASATTIDGAFALLDQVAQPSTRWSIVYDIRNRAVAWKTQKNRARRELRFAALDFRCASPVRIVDIDAGRGDAAAQFRDYTRAHNETLVRKSTLGTSFLRDTPEAEIVESARWPERAACSAH